jgi:hypothetical protein
MPESHLSSADENPPCGHVEHIDDVVDAFEHLAVSHHHTEDGVA